MGQTLSSMGSLLNKKENYMMSHENSPSVAASKARSDCNDSSLSSINQSPLNEKPHEHLENIYDSNSELSTITNSDTNGTEPDKSKFKLCENPNHTSKKKKNPWALKFNCPRLKGSGSSSTCAEPDIPNQSPEADTCICTGYRRTESQVDNSSEPIPLPLFIPKQNVDQGEPKNNSEIERVESTIDVLHVLQPLKPVVDLSNFNPEDYPIEDCDERARKERAREIEEGVDAPPGFSAVDSDHKIKLVCPSNLNLDNLQALFQSALSLSALSQIDVPKSVHTQVDFVHCLVPDLFHITSCSFYWGKMDRYEAERLLENKPEGTFLLRDSAQEEYLYSVSFRKYNRSLHARIEQWNHRFSFDSHDPGVFSSNTVCGLIEHYKDPTCCMFFEPMLTIPLHRNIAFSLQHLCRAVICDHLTYDSVSYLKLPKTLKAYLKEYHYKQRVRVRKFETET